jgi:uncharacterized membrane protein (UPF0136 family)
LSAHPGNPARRNGNILSAVGIALLVISFLLLLIRFAGIFAEYQFGDAGLTLSRELPVGSSEYGFSKTVKTHVISIADQGNQSVLILSVDGSEVKLISAGVDGSIDSQRNYPLDLSQSVAISAAILDDGSLQIWHLSRDLFRTVLDPRSDSQRSELVAESVLDFSARDDYLVFRTLSGLYAVQSDGQARRISDQRVLDYAFDRGDSGLIAIATVETLSPDAVANRRSSYRSRLYTGPVLTELESMERIVELVPPGQSDYHRQIVDIHAGTAGIDIAYLFEDRRFGINYLSFIRAGEEAYGVKSHLAALPNFSSRYTLFEADDGKSGLIFQREDNKGVNLALYTQGYPDEDQSGVSIEKLSDTRYLSRLGGYHRIAGRNVLVFSDLREERRQIYIASDHPNAIARGQQREPGDWIYVAGMTLLLALVASIMGFLFIMATAPPALIAGALMGRVRRRAIPWRMATYGLSLALYVPAKLLAMSNLMAKPSNTALFPISPGAPMLLAGAGTAAMAFLMFLIINRPWQDREDNPVSGVIRIILYDYTLTVPLFLIYLAASLLIRSI